MKVLVISDSHGNVANLKHVMGFGKKIKVGVVIHCGDWDTIETVDAVLSFGIPLFTVLGNADIREDVIQKLKVKSQKFNEKFLVIELGGRKIGITHKPSDNKKYFLDKKLDIIFNGHLHSKYESKETPIKVVRAGALINGINFAVYETRTNQVGFVQPDL
jgi:putative phosphoesterase